MRRNLRNWRRRTKLARGVGAPSRTEPIQLPGPVNGLVKYPGARCKARKPGGGTRLTPSSSCSRFSPKPFELAALYFPIVRPRNRIRKNDAICNGFRGPLRQPCQKIAVRDFSFRDDDREYFNDGATARHAHDADIRDIRMSGNYVLEIFRVYLHAAGVDDARLAPADAEQTVRVDNSDVSHNEPSRLGGAGSTARNPIWKDTLPTSASRLLSLSWL